MTTTTGEDSTYYELDKSLSLVNKPMPDDLQAVVDRIGENCEPALCTVMFQAGAGGSLRAGVSENPISITRSVADGTTQVTMGGAASYVFPGGGITVMVDVSVMPDNAFGQLVFAAPDIKRDLLAQKIEALDRITDGVTLYEAAVESGFEPMKIDALAKVKQGLTDEAEVFRVLH